MDQSTYLLRRNFLTLPLTVSWDVRLTWNVFAIKASLSRGDDLRLVLGDDGDHVRGPVGQVESVVPQHI